MRLDMARVSLNVRGTPRTLCRSSFDYHLGSYLHFTITETSIPSEASTCS